MLPSVIIHKCAIKMGVDDNFTIIVTLPPALSQTPFYSALAQLHELPEEIEMVIA